jgi:6,7-dimethyl-8-ribityllumazine synthase
MGDRPHLMVVESRYYDDIATELRNGAAAAIEKAGASAEIYEVPGALEIPAAIRFAVKAMDVASGRRRFDGYVALGCVIRGETTHYDTVAGESARGLMDLALRHSLALGNGILTCETHEQAWVRAAVNDGDKGGLAARACLAMIEIKRRLKLFPR